MLPVVTRSLQMQIAMTARVLIVAICLAGCATNHEIKQLMVDDVGEVDETVVHHILNDRLPYKTPQQKSARDQVDGEIRHKVKWWIKHFSTRDREWFQDALDRGEGYRPSVQNILSTQNLPEELYYLAVIESGFSSRATSSTSAVGIWQFMKPTALSYGLKVKPGKDERKNPVLATHAAARYLKSLHRQFDSWYLAIAAYNSGPGRIRQAIKKAKTRDFWELAEQRVLPQETLDYIPKFLAAATLAKHMDDFGMHAPSPDRFAMKQKTLQSHKN